jgi:hypothetical protein
MDEYERARRSETEMIETLGRMEDEERRIDEDARHIRENMRSALEAARQRGDLKRPE